ncbi:MAG: hypothetical protein CMF11_09435 [Idiomarina sp.]|nr:hypothetical protein [Idiomarina sp.]
MAKQTLKSLLGSSDERKQVELNLNPVALQPTIRSGGNYRVAVQDTPKTNSALQLADALRQGVGLYGQAVNIAQDKAETDVASMSEEDFDKFLEQGLDKESRSIFGYTKAYNQALAKKYYAEEMPMKLQAIAAELHRDPYAYKDPAEFEAAAIAAVNEAYDEADELLGGNVFSAQANNALKSATKADFVAKQQATYLAKLPEITRKVQADVAFKAFSEIDDVANVKDIIDQQILAVASAVGNKKDAAAIVTKAYLDNIEALAKQEGKEELAQALLDELDDTTVAGLGSQGRRKFGKDGIELFNTSANRLRIEQLEDDIEKAGVSGYNAKILRAREASAFIELEAFGLIKEADGDETTALARFEEIEDAIVKGSLELNGVTYTDTTELNEIRKFIAGARNNKDLFVHNAKLNFINNNTGGKRAAVNQLTTQGALASINQRAAARLVSVKPNPVTGGMDVSYTPEGTAFLSDFNSQVEQLELQLADALLGDTSLSVGERITEYSKLYPTEVTAKMQEWVSTRLEQISPAEVTTEKRYITDEREAYIRENYLPSEAAQIIEDEIATAKDAEREYNLFTRRDNMIVFNSSPEDDMQLLPKDPTEVYKTARDEGIFTDDDRQAKAFNSVFKSFLESPYGGGAKDRAIKEYNRSPWFRNLTPLEQAEKNKVLRDKISLYGISLEELLNGEFGRRFGRIPLERLYGKNIDFRSFPIVINGDIRGIIKEVKAYKENPSKYENKDLERLASKNNISLSNLMDAQYSFLTNSRFITE